MGVGPSLCHGTCPPRCARVPLCQPRATPLGVPVPVRPLTPAGEPGPGGRGCVVVPGAVHALDALVPVDDLEDLADEGAGLLGGVLEREGERVWTGGCRRVAVCRWVALCWQVPVCRGYSPCWAQRG